MEHYYNSLIPDSLSGAGLDEFLAMGWFRMQQSIFTTSHFTDSQGGQVHWLRLPMLALADATAHRRIRRRNQSFAVQIDNFTNIPSSHEDLFSRYRKWVNFETVESVRDYLFGDDSTNANIFETRCITVLDKDKLIAVGYIDMGCDSAAGILNFFDPDYKRFSLGKYLMLLSVDYLMAKKLLFYYPGYLIAGEPKMDYKLFLGELLIQYYDPETKSWLPYHKGLHTIEVPLEANDEANRILTSN